METLGYVTRFVAYVAILAIVGAVAFRLLILKRSGLTIGTIGRGSRRSAAIGAFASMVLVVVDIVKLGLQTSEMRFPTDSWIKVALTMLLQTSWGTVWMIQVAGAILLAMTFSLARKDALPRWNVLAVMSIGLAATPAFASHAMSPQRLLQYAIPADIAHVLGVSLWLGTLGVMFASILGGDGSEPRLAHGETQSTTQSALQSASFSASQSTSQSMSQSTSQSTSQSAPHTTSFSTSQLRANYMASLLRTFSPWALTGAALVVASGLTSALVHIEHWADLTGTRYGQTLLLKVSGVGVIVLLGWRNWKFVTPGIPTQGPARMTRGMSIELLIALVILGLTAALVVTPPPAEVMTH